MSFFSIQDLSTAHCKKYVYSSILILFFRWLHRTGGVLYRTPEEKACRIVEACAWTGMSETQYYITYIWLYKGLLFRLYLSYARQGYYGKCIILIYIRDHNSGFNRCSQKKTGARLHMIVNMRVKFYEYGCWVFFHATQVSDR